MSENLLLKANDISKDYFDGPKVLHILRGVTLELNMGQCISIVGSSGSGKSTLLHLLGALDKPTKGDIEISGIKLNTLNDNQLADIRNKKIGVIYQFHHLLPEFSALENVMIPAFVANQISKDKIKENASKILKEVGLEERMHHRPSKLSGGEQQRVALARALVNDPDMILADEPTGDLDPDTATLMIDLIWEKVIQRKKSMIIVTHDYSIAKRADVSYKIENGTLKKIEWKKF